MSSSRPVGPCSEKRAISNEDSSTSAPRSVGWLKEGAGYRVPVFAHVLGHFECSSIGLNQVHADGSLIALTSLSQFCGARDLLANVHGKPSHSKRLEGALHFRYSCGVAMCRALWEGVARASGTAFSALHARPFAFSLCEALCKTPSVGHEEGASGLVHCACERSGRALF